VPVNKHETFSIPYVYLRKAGELFDSSGIYQGQPNEQVKGSAACRGAELLRPSSKDAERTENLDHAELVVDK
jgi:hypothetical protein